MTEIPFAPGVLPELRARLDEVGRSLGFGPRRVAELLAGAVVDYEERGQLTCQELLDRVPELASELRPVRESSAAAIGDHVSTACRGCMFHNDACFMNVIFLVFKSVETGRPVAPNRVRPSMRIVLRG